MSDVFLGDLLAQQGVNSAVGNGVGGASFGGWSDWSKLLLGGKDPSGMQTNSLLGAGMGILQGLGSAYMGMQQYGLAKEQLQFSKDSFNKNYAAQAKMTNAMLEDRQRARVAANPGAYQSVGDYMAKSGIQ